MSSWLSECGFTFRGGTWYSKDNRFSWTEYSTGWGLHIVKDGYADYMVFNIETKSDFKTILRLVGYDFRI